MAQVFVETRQHGEQSQSSPTRLKLAPSPHVTNVKAVALSKLEHMVEELREKIEEEITEEKNRMLSPQAMETFAELDSVIPLKEHYDILRQQRQDLLQVASEDKLRALQSLAHHLADRFHAHRDEVVAAYELELRRVREAAQRAADAAAQILREAADGGAGGVALPNFPTGRIHILRRPMENELVSEGSAGHAVATDSEGASPSMAPAAAGAAPPAAGGGAAGDRVQAEQQPPPMDAHTSAVLAAVGDAAQASWTPGAGGDAPPAEKKILV